MKSFSLLNVCFFQSHFQIFTTKRLFAYFNLKPMQSKNMIHFGETVIISQFIFGETSLKDSQK